MSGWAGFADVIRVTVLYVTVGKCVKDGRLMIGINGLGIFVGQAVGMLWSFTCHARLYCRKMDGQKHVPNPNSFCEP